MWSPLWIKEPKSLSLFEKPKSKEFSKNSLIKTNYCQMTKKSNGKWGWTILDCKEIKSASSEVK